MEAFLQTSSNYVTRRAWRSVLRKVRANPDYDHKVEVENIVNGARNSFYFYLLSTLASRGTAANRQLFFITLVMKHKGLSRNGLRLFGLMNLGLSPRSYDFKFGIRTACRSRAEVTSSTKNMIRININENIS